MTQKVTARVAKLGVTSRQTFTVQLQLTAVIFRQTGEGLPSNL